MRQNEKKMLDRTEKMKWQGHTDFRPDFALRGAGGPGPDALTRAHEFQEGLVQGPGVDD